MQKLLFVQPSLQPPGGGNLVASWMVQAMRDRYRVHLLVWRDLDLEAINRMFGTSLARDDFELHCAPRWLAALIALAPIPQAHLRASLRARRGRRLHARHGYAVQMSANNEVDFGVKGIQYVHYPWMKLPRPEVDVRWFHRLPGVLRAYWAVTGWVGGRSLQRMRDNITLVNSSYIARIYREVHARDPIVLHPPAPGEFPEVAWEGREDSFVCLGRTSPEKKVLSAIDIVAGVRQRGHEVGLHLVGHPGVSESYNRAVQQAVEDNDWIWYH